MVFLAIELCLTMVCVALAQVHPTLGEGWFSSIERRFAGYAQHRTRTIVTIGLLALGLRLALLPQLPIPQPKVVDEFGYLLLSDTFSHGRLTNPTHPMWIHFETFLENWKPTYASMYYPGYGLFLAFGQSVMGHPFWGVWLSSGLMCAAICWALYGWVPPGWALLGSLLVVVRIATYSYWVDSYWGGTVTALGGALVVGALPRIVRNLRVLDSVLLALGMAILEYTRPYEGLFFCLPVLSALVFWQVRKNALQWKLAMLRVALPIAFIMLVATLALGYYFDRVTGNPLTTPYQVNMRTYGLLYFPWQKITPIEFHHEALRTFYRGGPVIGWYEVAREHPFKLQFLKIWVIWLFYLGPILSLPWLAWLFTRSKGPFWKSLSAEFRLLVLMCAVTYLSCVLTIYVGQPHYVAQLTVVFYAILLLMMRDMYESGNSGLKFLARCVPLVCFVLFLARAAAPALHVTPPPSWTRTWCSQDEQNLERARLLKVLEQMPGQQLVIVRYGSEHDLILNEWVFNNADIDGSKVIWARDMGAQNSELVHFFSNRRAWLVEADLKPPRLSPYVEQ